MPDTNGDEGRNTDASGGDVSAGLVASRRSRSTMMPLALDTSDVRALSFGEATGYLDSGNERVMS
jgi:hypothetical protein